MYENKFICNLIENICFPSDFSKLSAHLQYKGISLSNTNFYRKCHLSNFIPFNQTNDVSMGILS